MTVLIKQLKVPVKDTQPDSHIRQQILATYGLKSEDLKGFRIIKKSLDARKKTQIVYHYQVEADIEDEGSLLRHHGSTVTPLQEKSAFDPIAGLDTGGRSFRNKPIIIGTGPAGIFAAHVLSEAGHPCILVERGEAVEDRLRTVNRLRRRGEFSEKSNFCFGEGGAGTFSDGKLTCGRNHPLIKYLFQEWVRFGAPKEILYDAHPHIGTDFLMVIAKRMREHLVSQGCEFKFNKTFVDFTAGSDGRYQLQFQDGDCLETDHLIMAIGHSARDTYQRLLERGLAIGPKPFAIGARIEHPQEVIDEIQFGSCKLLPAAEYKLAARSGDRGIWTFCMCPGGQLLPTNAQAQHLAINGMSYHARTSGFANAAVVVNINREDFYRGHPLDGMHYQAAIERQAFKAGGSQYFTPAQRLPDFLKGRLSKGDLKSSYKPGVTSSRLDQILPESVVTALQAALVDYNKKMRGFISHEAIVAGVETKTSSPIVMHRDKGLQSLSHPGLFPTGEGAGFAGGIVSAALDGLKVGRAVLENALSENLMTAP